MINKYSRGTGWDGRLLGSEIGKLSYDELGGHVLMKVSRNKTLNTV